MAHTYREMLQRERPDILSVATQPAINARRIVDHGAQAI